MSEAKVREVFPGVFLLHLPLPMKPTIVNVYLVRGSRDARDDIEWALVDTGIGSADSIAAFRECLDIAGCRPDQVGKIIVTHHHPDHFGCAQPLKDLTGADIYIHPAEWQRSEFFMPSERPQWVLDWFTAQGLPWERFGRIPRQRDFWQGLYKPAAVDVELSDGLRIPVGERTLEAVWTPGHAPGHCVIYLREERVMIAGDHLLPRITPHVGFGPGSEGNPLGDFIASQEKIQKLDVDLALPAHGGVMDDHVKRSNQIIQHHYVRLEQILDILRREPRTGYEIARRAFDFGDDSPVTYQFPATFETLAHVEYLRQQGVLKAETGGDGVVLYGLANG
jgi:glyoxylase-like metal-dependent hydrolase (beta-lactamase superfamily II)